MQAQNINYSSDGLSNLERYDITINSLTKIKEEMDKDKGEAMNAICNQAISEILRDSYKKNDELRDIKRRIEELLSDESGDESQKKVLESISKKIDKFYAHIIQRENEL